MSGQIIMTTHSPVVVAECRTSELFIIQSKDGITTAYSLHNIEGETNEIIQRELRRNPEAFLCKRIIVCEGKTEIGFVRALDNFISQKYQFRMACEGVGTALGGGDQVFDCAVFLKSRGYDVCVFMDSDLDGKSSEKEEALKVHGVNTYDWDVGNSIEEQFFFDSTTSIVEEMIQIAVNEKGIETITIKLKDIPYTLEGGIIKVNDILTPIQRKQIGTISKQKKSAWYKRIDLGEELGNVIFRNWQDINKGTTLYMTIDKLITWVRKYE